MKNRNKAAENNPGIKRYGTKSIVQSRHYSSHYRSYKQLLLSEYLSRAKFYRAKLHRLIFVF